jgi:DNA repair exonuclease SbcCD ATPase subunit
MLMWLVYKRREELQKARAGQAELKGEIEGLERRMGTHAAEKASLQEKEKQLEQKKVSLWHLAQGA